MEIIRHDKNKKMYGKNKFLVSRVTFAKIKLIRFFLILIFQLQLNAILYVLGVPD